MGTKKMNENWTLSLYKYGTHVRYLQYVCVRPHVSVMNTGKMRVCISAENVYLTSSFDKPEITEEGDFFLSLLPPNI